MKAKKRAAPEPASPVVSHGIRYEAIRKGKARGFDQDGGYLAAIDERSGQELWTLKVYEVDFPEDIEDDKKVVDITELELEGTSTIIVHDERGRSFRVNTETRAVTEL